MTPLPTPTDRRSCNAEHQGEVVAGRDVQGVPTGCGRIMDRRHRALRLHLGQEAPAMGDAARWSGFPSRSPQVVFSRSRQPASYRLGCYALCPRVIGGAVGILGQAVKRGPLSWATYWTIGLEPLRPLPGDGFFCDTRWRHPRHRVGGPSGSVPPGRLPDLLCRLGR